MVQARQIIIFSAVTLVALVVMVSARNVMVGNTLPVTGNAVQETTYTPSVSTGDVQKGILKMVNYEYVTEPATFVAGVPVELTVDLNTVTGCMRDVVMSSFGVRQYVKVGDNVIKFTPTKAGEFQVMCSMGMGRGKINILESDGSKSNFVEPQVAAPAGSCGAGGGGCGCGGA